MTTLSFQESLSPEGKAIVVNGQTVAVATENGFEVLKGSLLAALLTSQIVGSDVATPLNVVSYGSNANGNWVRFAGGLQICWLVTTQSLTINSAYGDLFLAALTWTFPASFAYLPSSKLSGKWSSGGSWVGGENPNLNSVNYYLLDASTRSASNTILTGIAIGLWK